MLLNNRCTGQFHTQFRHERCSPPWRRILGAAKAFSGAKTIFFSCRNCPPPRKQLHTLTYDTPTRREGKTHRRRLQYTFLCISPLSGGFLSQFLVFPINTKMETRGKSPAWMLKPPGNLFVQQFQFERQTFSFSCLVPWVDAFNAFALKLCF